MKETVHIWDWPLRLFHWLLVIAVVGAYVTGKLGGDLTDWHGRIGGLILGLLIFRIIWGFVGTTHARFVNFFPTFGRLAAYFKGNWHGIGHNPVGALSVLALLAVLTVLAATGLFANDDIAFEGPLFSLIDKSLSDKLSGIHALALDVLMGLLALHLAAIAFHQLVKKNNLVLPMLTGRKQVHKAQASSIPAVGALRFLMTVVISSTLVWSIWSGNVASYLNPVDSLQTAAVRLGW
ncbi:cytochrome b/b6 domain-containing protein [Methylobacter sp. BlB1]|uniref:cytochrome b/b6 domain-containing protein n=1 Tax=Methylobacter sp. BlB1 TaxID=2785914 RepID=UPI001895A8C2|nr:cytochrome b/b6 domain-containing protein [Methylobacter sp. BlB1]MBF6650829.1 cytochrome b/b6 domain-containing protein [Methylobacter sp. BlB1]